ncbi:MAG: hypothetical protein EBT36_04755 [Betaproteobacteria bacterium]|nr:hypothetical protein [Betaproteobacteria bacterium]NBP34839.1 hypothetical protein [Betaproteobacteria bacterium]NBP38212.1 hypothetical protein [Betaproteobacteria bacterium]NBQ78072.1 hypothetical protein [Betaproteobacteria bacterium]NBQ94116.1 hypothetical protein [Betaproteobacteria bacterium]
MTFSTKDPFRQQLARHIALLIADHGLEPGQARKRALEAVSGGQRLPQSALPDSLDIDHALLEHLECFDPQHGQRVRRMREVAVAMMRQIAPTPVLATGAVWKGIASQDAPIHLQAFPDDEKQLHFQLLDLGLDPEPLELRHFRTGRTVEALGVHWRQEAIMIAMYSPVDFRGALQPSQISGQTVIERGDLRALEAKLAFG